MRRELTTLSVLLLSLMTLCSCSYNPLISNNHITGSPVAGAVGAGAGAGLMAWIGAPKPIIVAGGISGGMFGYYLSTLRHDAGPIIDGGGNVYQVGKLVGIYVPTDHIFEPNTAELLPDAHIILDSVVKVLERYPNNNIMISGNTSGFARSRFEQHLSELRAKVVSAYLWKWGIGDFKQMSNETRQLNYVGYGDYFPIANHYTNKGIRANSRIQITSYPSDCDLHLNRRKVTFGNIGVTDDQYVNRYSNSPCSQDPTSQSCAGFTDRNR